MVKKKVNEYFNNGDSTTGMLEEKELWVSEKENKMKI